MIAIVTFLAMMFSLETRGALAHPTIYKRDAQGLCASDNQTFKSIFNNRIRKTKIYYVVGIVWVKNP